jgi:broad specificity phosphatase PhoE
VTTFLLVRHGAFDGLGRTVSGRIPGLGLNETGRAQCRRVAERLRDRPVAAVYSSPLQRALDSAAILAHTLSAPLRTEFDLREVEFGSWTDRTVDDVSGDPAWRAFHEQRTTTTVPGGESMLAVQTRALACLTRLVPDHVGEAVVCVSHADVIRSVVAACLGFSLDAMVRLTLDPASITELCLGELPPSVIRVNDTAHLVSSID